MDAEQIIYDLAMIYARERFRDALVSLTEEQKLNYGELTELLYQHFEDAYTAFLTMPEKSFDFSDCRK